MVLWILQLFACVQRIRGVDVRRELVELRRGHDSTGLRAEPKLNTPLSRCASPENRCAVRVASETTQQIEKGEPSGSPFSLHFECFSGNSRNWLSRDACAANGVARRRGPYAGDGGPCDVAPNRAYPERRQRPAAAWRRPGMKSVVWLRKGLARQAAPRPLLLLS